MKSLLPLAFVAITPLATFAQGSLQARVHAVLDAKGSFRDTVTVNGKPVDQLEVMRTIVYRYGHVALDNRILSLAIEAEVEQRKNAGDETDYEIKTEDIDAELGRLIREAGEAETFWKQQAAKGVDRETTRKQVAAYLLFDRLFVDGPPKDWPKLTKDAIRAQKQGGQLLKTWEGNTALPAMMRRIVRAWVTSYIKKNATIRYACDGLPPEHCIEVNGRPWKTRLALREIGDYGREGREAALVEVALDMAIEQELATRNALLSKEETDKAYREYAKTYKPPFTIEVLATAFKGYPNLTLFKKRWGLRHCFERMIAKEITNDALAAHAAKRQAFLSGAKLDVGLIRIPTGVEEVPATLERARRLRKAIDSGKLSFARAFSESSSWNGKPPAAELAYNTLRTVIGENEYNDYLTTCSNADTLFFEADKGDIVGPFEAQDAVFLARVRAVPTPKMPLDLTRANIRKMVREDYVTQRFIAWVREIAKQVDVR